MKTYHYRPRLGRTQKPYVSFHDGEKNHSDGSPFYDLRIFSRTRDAERFVRQLRREGFAPV